VRRGRAVVVIAGAGISLIPDGQLRDTAGVSDPGVVFPLRLGAIRIGVLLLCLERSGGLDADELAYASCALGALGVNIGQARRWVIMGARARRGGS
jgi:hypothetical protein